MGSLSTKVTDTQSFQFRVLGSGFVFLFVVRRSVLGSGSRSRFGFATLNPNTEPNRNTNAEPRTQNRNDCVGVSILSPTTMPSSSPRSQLPVGHCDGERLFEAAIPQDERREVVCLGLAGCEIAHVLQET